MSFIIEDYSIQNEDLLKNESLFHVANGYLGVRGNFEEGYRESFGTIRGTYINAFHEVNNMQYSEKLHGFPETKQNILNIIDAQTI
jgi:alpha,alpha-trehalose phosphorylase